MVKIKNFAAEDTEDTEYMSLEGTRRDTKEFPCQSVFVRGKNPNHPTHPTHPTHRTQLTQPNHLKSGFTLIELILAITILFMAVAAVFYFYSQSMEHQAKLKEKYRILRIGKQFVDSYIFSTDPEKLTMTDGKREVEDFILQWNVYPVEDEREVIFTSGLLPLAQLKRVHLEIIKKTTGKSVLDLHFLVNTISPPET